MAMITAINMRIKFVSNLFHLLFERFPPIIYKEVPLQYQKVDRTGFYCFGLSQNIDYLILISLYHNHKLKVKYFLQNNNFDI